MTLTEPEVRATIAGALTMMFLAALETTIVATALPSIAADLGEVHMLSWIVTAYLLTSTCVTPIAGKLGDLQVINGSEILLGAPYTFTKENIGQFDF